MTCIVVTAGSCSIPITCMTHTNFASGLGINCEPRPLMSVHVLQINCNCKILCFCNLTSRSWVMMRLPTNTASYATRTQSSGTPLRKLENCNYDLNVSNQLFLH